MTRYTKFITPLGTVLATAAGGFITSVNFIDAKLTPPVAKDWDEDPDSSPLKECAGLFRLVRNAKVISRIPLECSETVISESFDFYTCW